MNSQRRKGIFDVSPYVAPTIVIQQFQHGLVSLALTIFQSHMSVHSIVSLGRRRLLLLRGFRENGTSPRSVAG